MYVCMYVRITWNISVMNKGDSNTNMFSAVFIVLTFMKMVQKR